MGTSQRNKAHKAGRRAGLSAREKHRSSKGAASEQRQSVRATRPGAELKADRAAASKQQRNRRRAALFAQRRNRVPPHVAALLPLSHDVDVQRLWGGLLAACSDGDEHAAPGSSSRAADGMDVDADHSCAALAMTTLALAGRQRVRFTLLPPPAARTDPLAIVELGRSADCVLLAMPGDVGTEAIDDAGGMALSVLRSLGLPRVVALVQSPAASSGRNPLKDVAAAKKHAARALQEQLPGDFKLLPTDTALDFKQLLRHLADATPSVPQWRQHRPALLVEAADFHVPQAKPEGAPAIGTLLLRGYVRGRGLSANQAVHIAGAGDFQLAQIDGISEPPAANELAAGAGQRRLGMDAVRADEHQLVMLARPDAQRLESLARENLVDPLAGEQTWPTEEEVMEAEAGAARRKRRLPRGTSDYQAAWILDDSDLDDTDLESESGSGSEQEAGVVSDGECMPGLEPSVPGSGVGDADTSEVGMDEEDEMEEEEQEEAATKLDGLRSSLKEQRRQEHDDQMFPDEVDTPEGVPARQRFAKYRGLKSFRTSPWDPRESLPRDYARVFAFEIPRRAHKRAIEASLQAGSAGDPHSVPAGTYVQLHVACVRADVAGRVLQRVAACQHGTAAPLVAFGLLQHECKLSVQHYGVRKAATYSEPLASKEPLLLVNGLRSFYSRPVFSTDEHGADKHKMERFLHDGRPSVATIFAPIAYPPLPLLAFKVEGGVPRLAATGSLRGCDPDRIVLKKIVLSGYPVKVHKAKAVVRFMFHNPDDVRWFRPVELWTRSGRRGRIREPIGTHGAMKCVFDGALRQQDAVLMSLYKRAHPVWPECLEFVA